MNPIGSGKEFGAELSYEVFKGFRGDYGESFVSLLKAAKKIAKMTRKKR